MIFVVNLLKEKGVLEEQLNKLKENSHVRLKDVKNVMVHKVHFSNI